MKRHSGRHGQSLGPRRSRTRSTRRCGWPARSVRIVSGERLMCWPVRVLTIVLTRGAEVSARHECAQATWAACGARRWSRWRSARRWRRRALAGALEAFVRVETTAEHVRRALQAWRLLAERSQRGNKIPDPL